MIKKAIVFGLIITSLLSLTAPIMAYDSNPPGSDTDMVEYYEDIFEPAISAPEMNLESFVHETLKSLVWGTTFHYIFGRTFLRDPYYVFICSYKISEVYLDEGNIIDRASALTDATSCVLNHVPDVVNNKDLWDIILKAMGITQVPSTTPVAQNPIQKISQTFNIFNAAVKNTPSSGFGYFRHLVVNAGLINPVYAQSSGFGYGAMSSLIPYWKAFRNLAYTLSAIGLVVAGFMIMFRMKLSPQTVVTIQSAVPKAVITLILITFSYAIAGFILDLVWVFTLLLGSIIADFAATEDGAKEIISSLQENNSLTFMIQHGTGPGFIAVFAGLGSLIFSLVGGIGLGAYEIIAFVVFLILGIAVLFATFKIMFMLIKTFIFFVLYTIIAPLWIFLGVFPSVSGFGSWFKALVGQAIVFPVTAVLLTMSVIFMSGQGIEGTDRVRLPLMGAFSSQHAVMVLGLGLFLYTPKISDMIQKLLRTLALGEGFALNESLGMIISPRSPLRQGTGQYLERLGNQIRTGSTRLPGGKVIEKHEKLGNVIDFVGTQLQGSNIKRPGTDSKVGQGPTSDS